MDHSPLTVPVTPLDSCVILKFGGAAVATPESFSKISDIIIERQKVYPRVVVVVSAMGDTTDELIALAKKVHPDPPRRELDMLVSVGERISIALLAMALSAKHKQAVSFTGSQCGIITTNEHFDAKIVEIKPKRLLQEFQNSQDKIIIVAGYQGMSLSGDITTLGRGGSDTTAVGLGVALKAQRVEFFKDVNGIYNKDPKSYPDAQLVKYMNFSEALELVNRSHHHVLHPRCISLAKNNHLTLHVLPFSDHTNQLFGTEIYDSKDASPVHPPIFETK